MINQIFKKFYLKWLQYLALKIDKVGADLTLLGRVLYSVVPLCLKDMSALLVLAR
jgi:hypothetical protein